MSDARSGPVGGGAVEASVIVPTHGGAHRLGILLDALAAQVDPGPWELVVVLDGVVDATPDLLAAWADRLPLHVMQLAESGGVCAALDAGYAAARGRVLIRCDDDLTPPADFVRRHTAWHDDSAPRAVIGLTRDELAPTPYAVAYGFAAESRARAAALARPAERRWMHWAANNSLTRATWDAVGGFDPRFVYGQDGELGWRLHRAGVEVVIDPHLEAAHRGACTDAAARVARAYVSGAARRLFAEVHPEADRGEVPAAGRRARAWDALTSVLADRVRTREGWRRAGGALDRALPVLPLAVGSRAVAAAVEAAGRSGQRHGSVDLARYRTQKQDQLRVERGGVPRGAHDP